MVTDVVRVFSVGTYAVTVFEVGTDAVTEKSVWTDAVTEFSVEKYQLQRQLQIQMHISSQRRLLGIQQFFDLSTEEYFHTI